MPTFQRGFCAVLLSWPIPVRRREETLDKPDEPVDRLVAIQNTQRFEPIVLSHSRIGRRARPREAEDAELGADVDPQPISTNSHRLIDLHAKPSQTRRSKPIPIGVARADDRRFCSAYKRVSAEFVAIDDEIGGLTRRTACII